LDAFAELSGDKSPIHIDSNYAESTKFGEKIIHGMFLGALVSRLIGMQLPGKYGVLMKEELEFKNPAKINDLLKVSGSVTNKSDVTKIIEISIEITREIQTLVKGTVNVILLK
jgi:3-hydroxybutyryl-CoA dehydratase